MTTPSLEKNSAPAFPRQQVADLVAGKTVSQILGEIVWLLSQSPQHKHLTLSDVERLIMPAILLKQFRLEYLGDVPVVLDIFALVDEPTKARLERRGASIAQKDWKSGTVRVSVLRAELHKPTSPQATN